LPKGVKQTAGDDLMRTITNLTIATAVAVAAMWAADAITRPHLKPIDSSWEIAPNVNQWGGSTAGWTAD
jgi:hypothetical protein